MEATRDELETSHAIRLRAQLSLAKLAVGQGSPDRADALFTAALALASPGSPLHGEAVVTFARYLFESDRHDEVVDVLTQARLSKMDGGTRAEGLSLRGFAQWELAENRPGARAQVREASKLYEQHPGSFPDRAAQTRAWLLEHRP